MNTVLVASCGHKGYLTPWASCESIAKGLKRGDKRIIVDVAPMADGGDGTIDVIVSARDGQVIMVEVHDALFRSRLAKLGITYSGGIKTAIIEIAEAAGSAILKPYERQTMVATSYGVGEMILSAVGHGCSRIIVGLGGSIVSDGGIGMAQALGITFVDQEGNPLEPIGNVGFNALSLTEIESIKMDKLKLDVEQLEILVASDVDIRLTGADGQARNFGPQKNANSVEIHYLEEGFKNLARVIRKVFARSVDIPLAGAAGGLGAGLMGFLGGNLHLGSQLVAEEINLQAKIEQCDFVIVGEGCLDHTTLRNKGPQFVGKLAKQMNKRVLAIVGMARQNSYSFYDRLFTCERDGQTFTEITPECIRNQLEYVAAKVAQTALA